MSSHSVGLKPPLFRNVFFLRPRVSLADLGNSVQLLLCLALNVNTCYLWPPVMRRYSTTTPHLRDLVLDAQRKKTTLQHLGRAFPILTDGSLTLGTDIFFNQKQQRPPPYLHGPDSKGMPAGSCRGDGSERGSILRCHNQFSREMRPPAEGYTLSPQSTHVRHSHGSNTFTGTK